MQFFIAVASFAIGATKIAYHRHEESAHYEITKKQLLLIEEKIKQIYRVLPENPTLTSKSLLALLKKNKEIAEMVNPFSPRCPVLEIGHEPEDDGIINLIVEDKPNSVSIIVTLTCCYQDRYFVREISIPSLPMQEHP